MLFSTRSPRHFTRLKHAAELRAAIFAPPTSAGTRGGDGAFAALRRDVVLPFLPRRRRSTRRREQPAQRRHHSKREGRAFLSPRRYLFETRRDPDAAMLVVEEAGCRLVARPLQTLPLRLPAMPRAQAVCRHPLAAMFVAPLLAARHVAAIEPPSSDAFLPPTQHCRRCCRRPGDDDARDGRSTRSMFSPLHGFACPAFASPRRRRQDARAAVLARGGRAARSVSVFTPANAHAAACRKMPAMAVGYLRRQVLLSSPADTRWIPVGFVTRRSAMRNDVNVRRRGPEAR